VVTEWQDLAAQELDCKTLKMDVASSQAVSVTVYQLTWCIIPKT